MDIRKYWGKKVYVEMFDGDIIQGFAAGFTDALNDPEGIDSLTIKTDRGYYGVFEDEIKTIKVID